MITILIVLTVIFLLMNTMSPQVDRFESVHIPTNYECRRCKKYLDDCKHSLYGRLNHYRKNLKKFQNEAKFYKTVGGRAGAFKQCCTECLDMYDKRTEETLTYYNKWRDLQGKLANYQMKLNHMTDKMNYFKKKYTYCRRDFTMKPTIEKIWLDQSFEPNSITGNGLNTTVPIGSANGIFKGIASY